MAITIYVHLIVLLTQLTNIISTNNLVGSSDSITLFNLTADDIPMFITITFDGVLNEDSYEHTDKILQHKNRNDEEIAFVFLINNDIEYAKNYSDYSVIQEMYLHGCEIGIHSAHTSLWDTNLNKWYYEINRSRELISRHSSIPTENLVGFRTTLFAEKKSNILNQVLHGLNPPFVCDSSKINNKLNTDVGWPYTLDNYSMYESDLWEIPIYDLDAMTNHTDTLMNELSYIFSQRYNDRSPINLRFNLTWLEDDSHVHVLNDFIEWVLRQDHTWFVTNQQLIEWMDDPVPNAEYNGPTIGYDNILIDGENTTSNFTFCKYQQGIFDTAQDECPDRWPYVSQWNINELVYTEINITTTEHNINKDYIFCHDNEYEMYDADSEYTDTGDIIQYEGKLYRCQWWSKGDIPGEAKSWLLVKDCNGVNDPFVRGNMQPYGIVNVFIQNELHIDIQAYNGYDTEIDLIFVIVDGDMYNLTIFDDYDWIVFDHTRGNDYELIIGFDEIKLPKYEIQISFTSDTVRASFIAAIIICCGMFVNH